MKSLKEKLSNSLKIVLLSALMTSSNMVHAEDTNNSTFQLDSEKREEIKQKWQNAPQEKKDAVKTKMREHWDNLSPEQKAARKAKIKQRVKNMNPEQKAALRERIKNRRQ